MSKTVQVSILEIRTEENGQTVYYDLLNGANGVFLEEWRPRRAVMKGGGVFQDSPMVDGRSLVHGVYGNVQETFKLKYYHDSPDTAAFEDAKLEQLLQKAMDNGRTQWQREPVYLAVQPVGASNVQYARIIAGQIKDSEDPFGTTWNQARGGTSAIGATAWDDIELIIERGDWLENPPGTGTAVSHGAQVEYLNTPGVWFDTVNDNLYAPLSPPDPSGDLCFEWWMKLNSLGRVGGGGNGYILNVYHSGGAPADDQITILVNSSDGKMYCTMDIDGGTNGTIATSATLTDDDRWHHYAVTWDGTAGSFVEIYVDGVAKGAAPVASSGAAVLATDWYIGNFHSAGNAIDGVLGWFRVSEAQRYTADFSDSVPDRQIPPANDADTYFLWGMNDGSGSTVASLIGGTALALTGASWLIGNVATTGTGDFTAGAPASTGSDIFYAHHGAQVPIHTAFRYNGSYSANLIGASLPQALLPTGATSILYLCSSAPFYNVIFNIGTAIAGTAVIANEYWDGSAWSALSDVQDDTGDFANTEAGCIAWDEVSNWAITTVNGVAGYWLRFRVSSGSVSTSPTQQTYNIYSACWPYVTWGDTAVNGDIAALGQLVSYRQDNNSLSVSPAKMTRYMGARSVDRGVNFSAFLPFSNGPGLPPGVQVIPSATGSTYLTWDNYRGISGVQLTFTGGSGFIINLLTIRISSTYAAEYSGRYRVLLRHRMPATTGTHVQTDLKLSLVVGDQRRDAYPYADDLGLGVHLENFLDFGEIAIGGNLAYGETIGDLDIDIDIDTSSGVARTLYLYDLILIPIDEWAAIVSDQLMIEKGVHYRDTSEIGYTPIADKTRIVSSGAEYAQNTVISNGRGMLENGSSKLWMVEYARSKSVSDSIGDGYSSPPELIFRAELSRNQRYRSFRGNQ